MSASSYVSDYKIDVRDGRLHVTNLTGVREPPDIFWKKIMLERYMQLERGDSPIVNVPKSGGLYNIIREELKKGIQYNGEKLVKDFNNVDIKFMLGKRDDGILTIRQLDGYPIEVDDLVMNNYILTRIKSVRRAQLESGYEELPIDTNIDKYIDDEIRKGIMLNNVYVKPELIVNIPSRTRRRR